MGVVWECVARTCAICVESPERSRVIKGNRDAGDQKFVLVALCVGPKTDIGQPDAP